MAIKRGGLAWASWAVSMSLGLAMAADPPPKPSTEIPHALDDRLEVKLFAQSPDIVHPIALEVDRAGRILAIESHTHFRPEGYQGPTTDRIRVLEDTDGDGRADRIGTFFEGTKFSMDLAAHPDGSIYLATRNEILRLRDDNGDGKADGSSTVVRLDTEGNYPHNGLSGLCFDSKGNLTFGMGENLGASYALRGSDGVEIKGGGEGGSLFWCSADGKHLRRIATGFWNPFGVARDIFGRVFAIDNDPDSMPPCRLLHVIEGGDYGYQFRYGRSGRHVFQAWNGELPGTLPMLSGTGESPCEVLSYESDGLPADYRGDLLVTTWADHRIDRYRLKTRGASFTSEPTTMVRGGKDFRPVGLVAAPDGSLVFSDWVLSDYTLHGKGALWQLRQKGQGTHVPSRPLKPTLDSPHRPRREAAARALASSEPGRATLRKQLSSTNPRIRAACLTALINAGDRTVDLNDIAEGDPEVGIQALAVRGLAASGREAATFANKANPPEVRLEAIAALDAKQDLPRLLTFLGDDDPFLRTSAVHQLARSPELLAAIDRETLTSAKRRAGLLLADRASGRPEATRLIAGYLADPDEDVRFLAVKWIADETLKEYAPAMAKLLDDRHINVRMYSAASTALARLQGRDTKETTMVDYFSGRLADDQSPPAVRAMALRLLPATSKVLTVDLLTKLLKQSDATLSLEAARTLSETPGPERTRALLAAAKDPGLDASVRAQAILGLSGASQDLRDELIALAVDDEETLRAEALRALIGATLTPAQRRTLEGLAGRDKGSAPLVARLLGDRSFAADRPPTEDVDAWLRRLEGPSDPEAGRRVFFQPKLAGCFRCHRVEGRGFEVGPDLSTIGRTERRRILGSILRPSDEIGPSYQAWLIATKDGKVATGMLVKTVLDQCIYLDEKGSLFTINEPDVAERRALSTSIMPSSLPDLFTDQELRDLLAYLTSRR